MEQESRNKRMMSNFMIGTAFSLLGILLLFRKDIAKWLQPPSDLSEPLPEHVTLAASKCFAILIVTIFLWATNALPLYITALLVVPLSISMRVFLDKDLNEIDDMHDLGTVALHSMAGDTVLQILAVYVINAAIKKTSFESFMSRFIFSIAKTPVLLIGTCMVLSVAMSIFLTNVLAPVILLSILTPVFHDLGPENKDFIKATILSIAVASNIGGMPSPIASPQNIVARDTMKNLEVGEVDMIKWMMITLPQCALMAVVGFTFIVSKFNVRQYTFEPRKYMTSNTRIGTQDLVVLSTFLLTVYLWLPLEDYIPAIDARHIFGNHDGIAALVPIIILFGSGTLLRSDFESLPWATVYLLAGGSCLGEAIKKSQLLDLIGFKLQHALHNNGSEYFAFVIVLIFMGLAASGISHTASSFIMLPLLGEFGVKLGHPQLFIMGAVLADSGAMGLPVSSFPNVSAFGVLDAFGHPYLEPRDIITTGFPMTLFCGMIIGTFGYVIMRGALG